MPLALQILIYIKRSFKFDKKDIKIKFNLKKSL